MNPEHTKPDRFSSRKKNPANHAVRKVRLRPAVDLAPYLHGWTVVSASLGYDGCAYVLLVDDEPQREDGFVPTQLKQTPHYRVLIADLRSGAGRSAAESSNVVAVEEIALEGESFHYHYVQPLGDELLLVGARSQYYGRDHYDLNAAVFDRNGLPLRRFLLGDGIQNVQTTADGLIWTGFFDEGVFGNYGWSRPVGESGLIAWDSKGIRVFTNSEADIADCYALNVVSGEELWFYYDTDFKLCRLSGPAAQPSVSFLDPNLAGSSMFATDGFRFLLDGGYGRPHQYALLHVSKPGRLERTMDIVLTKDDGSPLQAPFRDARGDRMLLLDGAEVYLFALNELE